MAARRAASALLARVLRVAEAEAGLLLGRGTVAGAAAAGTCRSTAVSSAAAAQGALRWTRGFATEVYYPENQTFVGEPAPEFAGPAVVDGEISNISLADYKGKYVVLFFYPKDFTFVCPTEIIAFSDRAAEFEALNCQLVAASTDTEESHLAWTRMSRKKGGLGTMQIPILADTTKEIAAKYGCLIEDLGIAARGLYIIDPEGVVQQITINNLPFGRCVDETLRLLQAMQFVAEHGEVCPANWKPGEKTMKADAEGSLEYFETVDEMVDDFSESLVPIANPAEYHEMINSGKKVVVDFMAPWCGKCRQIAPHVASLQGLHPDITFAKFDTTSPQLEGLAAELGIKAMPGFKFFNGGKEVLDMVTGYKKTPLSTSVTALESM